MTLCPKSFGNLKFLPCTSRIVCDWSLINCVILYCILICCKTNNKSIVCNKNILSHHKIIIMSSLTVVLKPSIFISMFYHTWLSRLNNIASSDQALIRWGMLSKPHCCKAHISCDVATAFLCQFSTGIYLLSYLHLGKYYH